MDLDTLRNLALVLVFVLVGGIFAATSVCPTARPTPRRWSR